MQFNVHHNTKGPNSNNRSSGSGNFNSKKDNVISLIDQLFDKSLRSSTPIIKIKESPDHPKIDVPGLKLTSDSVPEINELLSEPHKTKETALCNNPATTCLGLGSENLHSVDESESANEICDGFNTVQGATWEDSSPNFVITDVKSLNCEFKISENELKPAETGFKPSENSFKPSEYDAKSDNSSDEVTIIGTVCRSQNPKTDVSDCGSTAVKGETQSDEQTEIKTENVKSSSSIENRLQSSEKADCDKKPPVARKFSSRIRARASNNVKKPEDHDTSDSKSLEGMNGFGGTLLAVAVPAYNQLHNSMTKGRVNDPFCWVCHKENVNTECVVCPRAFHSKCVQKFPLINHLKKVNPNDWVCTECQKIMAAEDLDFTSQYSSKLSLEQLCLLLQFVIHRLKNSGAEPFLKPVSNSSFPSYQDYIIHPMDLFTLECNVKKKMYGSTHSFLADIRWILHNCIVFNGYHHALTGQAKNVVKVCKMELSEIETCPSCYLNSCTKMENWFGKPCAESHTLIWAKMKGFPYWPAKAMKAVENNVDARFFGAHDRAWVPINQCYLYSKEIPAPAKIKKKGLDEALEEAESYIEQIKQQFGSFKYASWKVPLSIKEVHVPTKFTLDVSWLEKQRINALHLFTNTSSRKTSFRQAIDSENNTNPDELIGGIVSNNGRYSAPSSVPSYLGSSPSVSPTSDISSLPQAIAFTTTESDCVTFGGGSVSPISSELKSKSVPVGVFELSPSMKTTMPRKLDVKVPKLDPARLTKSRSYDQAQKLQQAMEKIKENVMINQHASEQRLVEPEIPSPVSESGSLNDISVKDPTVSSPSCEVTSTTVITPDCSGISDASSFEISALAVDSPILIPTSAKTDFPSSDCYVKNLGKTIENCKAMLGIEVCEDVALVESESDSDDQVHSDGACKTESSFSNSQCANVLHKQRNVVHLPSNSADNFVANQNFNLGKHKTSCSTYPGPHTKRLKLSKICSGSGLLKQGSSTKSAGGSKTDSPLQVQCNDDTPGMISRSDMDKYTNKVMDFMKGTMEEMCKELGGVSSGYQNAAINALRMEIDMLNLRHQQEIAEITHNSRLVLMEMRNSLEIEKTKAIALLKETSEKSLKEAVAKTKKRQWCANCGNEAMFFCCWNTSYCDYRCQHKHWSKHMSQCTQLSSNNKLCPPDQPRTSACCSENGFAKPLESKNVGCERDNPLYSGSASQLKAQQANLNSHLLSTSASQMLALSSYQVSLQQNSTSTSLPAIYSNILNVGGVPDRCINKATSQIFAPASQPSFSRML